MPSQKPSMVVFPVPRDWIVSGELNPAIGLLWGLIRNREAIETFAGTVVLSFEGWDSDERELYEIPEVRAWFANISQVFPYWFVIGNRTTGTLPLVFNLLLDIDGQIKDGTNETGIKHPKGQVKLLTVRLLSAMSTLAMKHGIPEQTVIKWTADVTECMTAYTD